MDMFLIPIVMNKRKSLSKPCPSPKELFEDPTFVDLNTLHLILSELSDSEKGQMVN